MLDDLAAVPGVKGVMLTFDELYPSAEGRLAV